MKKILTYLKPYRWKVAGALALKGAGAFSELFLPRILTYMIDDVIPLEKLSLVLLWGGIMIACSVVCVVTNITGNRAASAVAREASRHIRHDLFLRTTYLSCAQADRVGVASLVSRMTTDTYNIHQILGMVQRLGVRAPLLLIGGVIMTLTVDVPLTFVMLGVLPFIALTVALVSAKGLPHFKKLQASIDQLVRVVRENVTGARIIKALCKTDAEIGRFNGRSGQVADDEARANVVMSVNQPVMNVLLNGGMVLVIWIGARRVDAGWTTPANIVSFLSYFTIIANAMMGVTRLFVRFSRASASASRIEEILEMPEDLLPCPAPEGDPAYRVEFRDVTFSYNDGRRPALAHVSFRLKKGQSLGIIGPTGSGKSTLIALLLRFYDAGSGAVYVDGRDVRSYDPKELHRKFGTVFQNDAVFSDTLRENVDFARSLSEGAMESAARDAQALEFIRALPEGWEEHIFSQGTNLSGGQRQRLLITRALAGDPDILILDDSSSALDFRTDADLRLALGANRGGATKVIVASRVSSIAHCDEILVLEDGEVIGQGTHEELLESCPAYSEIARMQMGGMADA